MGSAIALRLHREGIPVAAWNRSAQRSEAVAAEGVSVAADPAAAIRPAEIILLTLSDMAAIEATLLAPSQATLIAGKTVVQMSTISPEESHEVCQYVREQSGRYLEAPVLGSIPEALAGKLIVMAGGEPVDYERSLPLLRHLGEDVQLIGEVGQAAALKLAMNQLIAGLTATFALSLGLVRSQGIRVEQFMGLLRNSALYAPTFDKKLSKYLEHDYATANFPLRHLLKDIRLFQQVAEPLGLDAALSNAMADACERGIRAGHGDQDYSSIYEALTERG